MPIDLVAFLCYECIALRQGKVRLDHFTEHCFKRDLRRPAELGANLARVTKQGLDLGGPEITRIHPYNRVPAVAIDAQLAIETRTLQIFQLIGRGKSTRDIARELNVSVHTIDSHREHIRAKLNLRSGTELIQRAVQWHIENG